MRPLSVAAALACTAVLAPVAAQILLTAPPSAHGDLSLGGSVVNGVTGEPVRFALVRLTFTASPGTGRNMLTDANGRFRFGGLSEGQLMLTASKPGYQPPGSDGTKVVLDRSRDDSVIRLAPLATIRGRISDSSGGLLSGVTVQVFRSDVRDGARQNDMVTWTHTDDKGEYRFSDLVEGIYAVRAAGREAVSLHLLERTPGVPRYESFAPVYFGGSNTIALATLLPLRSGQEIRADLQVTLLPARRIRGVVRNLHPYRGAQIELLPNDDDTGAARVALNIASGRFEIQEVVDGTYRIRVTQEDGGRRLRAIDSVHVAGQDVDGVVLSLSAGGLVQGTLRVEGALSTKAPPIRPELVAMDDPPLRGIAQHRIPASLAVDGKIEFQPVPYGRYKLHFNVWHPKMYVASARLGDQDLLRSPQFTVGATVVPELEIVIHADAGLVNGRAPEGADLCVLTPESGEAVSFTTPAFGGLCTFGSVPPGMYRVSAWRNGRQLEFRRPDLLQLLKARGERLEVLPNQTTKVEVAAVSEIPE